MEEHSSAPMGLDLTRLRRGEITAACGALLVLLGLFVPPWYEASQATLEASGGPGGTIPASFGAWSGAGWLGTIGDLVILAAALFAIGTALAGARGIEWDGSGNRLFGLSVAAVVAVALRTIFTPTSLSGSIRRGPSARDLRHARRVAGPCLGRVETPPQALGGASSPIQ